MDDERFPGVFKVKQEIKDVELELKDYRKEIRLVLRQPSLDYVTVLQTEVRNKKSHRTLFFSFLLPRLLFHKTNQYRWQYN